MIKYKASQKRNEWKIKSYLLHDFWLIGPFAAVEHVCKWQCALKHALRLFFFKSKQSIGFIADDIRLLLLFTPHHSKRPICIVVFEPCTFNRNRNDAIKHTFNARAKKKRVYVTQDIRDGKQPLWIFFVFALVFHPSSLALKKWIVKVKYK